MISESLIKRIKERALTDADCTELDITLSENYSECRLEIDDLCYVLEAVMRSLGSMSLLAEEVISSLEMTELDMMIAFDGDMVDEYENALRLARIVGEHYQGIAMRLGDYYYDGPCDVLALERYREAFKDGLPMHLVGYWQSVECYVTYLEEYECLEELDRLLGIDCDLPDSMIDNDLVSVYLLRVCRTDISNPAYSGLLDEAIALAERMVKYLRGDKKKEYFGSSEEEETLCELLCLKFEYFATKKEYVRAMEAYRTLTEEIACSDAVRYYTARDRIYYIMLDLMASTEYPKVAFVRAIKHGSIFTSPTLDEGPLTEGRVITLHREDGARYDFVISRIYDFDVTLRPILPIVGEGGPVFFSLKEEDGKHFLVRK